MMRIGLLGKLCAPAAAIVPSSTVKEIHFAARCSMGVLLNEIKRR
jgi:hypothetical protein